VNSTEHTNVAARFCSIGPFRSDHYLATVVSARDSRPPDAAGVFILSERDWKGIPDQSANLVYAAQAPYLRYRFRSVPRRVGTLAKLGKELNDF